MYVRERKNRVVNFRLTEAELKRIRAAYLESDTRCLSEFLHDIICRSLQPPKRESGNEKLVELERRLAQMEERTTAPVFKHETDEFTHHVW